MQSDSGAQNAGEIPWNTMNIVIVTSVSVAEIESSSVIAGSAGR